MKEMGRDFCAPKKKDIEQWKVVEILYQKGITFHSCGCSGPGYRPTKLREVPEFLRTFTPKGTAQPRSNT
jgi:hypothetical protein